MPTLGRQYKPKRSFKNGVDNTTPIESPEIANTLSYCLNGEMVDSDIIKTRNGMTAITAVKSSYIIRQGIQYNKPDGTKEQIVYLESTTTTGTSAILGRINGSVIDSITTNLPDGIKPCLIQAGALLFIFNGSNDLIYDGTSTRQIGIDAPSVAPSFKNTIDGNLNEGGFYVYVYCYRNSITGATSSPSLPSPTITAGTQADNKAGIKIGLTAGDSSTADTIDVYRTASGQTIYYYDGSVPIDSTEYSSTVTDQGLGSQLEIDNSRLPEAAKFAVLLDNRLFVAGFKSNPSRIQHSKIGIEGSMYESFQISDIVDCNIDDGQAIVGLGQIGTKVGVVKENKAGKLIPTDISSIGLETGGSSKYLYKETNGECTSTSHHTIFTVGATMGWLGKDNIYITDGFEIQPIANRIRNTIRRLNFRQSYKFSQFTHNYNQQIILSVVTAGKTESDYQLVGHLIDSTSVGWTMFGPGSNPTTHPGLRTSAWWKATVNDLIEPYVGSSSGNGKVLQYGLGTNDDGYPIHFQIKDQWEPGIDGAGLKSFQSVKVLATTGAVSPNNTLTMTWEENGKEGVVKTGSSVVSTGIKWNEALFGTFTWAGLTYSRISFFPNRKSFLARWGCYNTTINSPMAIKSARILYRNISE